MDRVQKVSEQARADVEPTKPTGPQLNLDDGEDKPQKTEERRVRDPAHRRGRRGLQQWRSDAPRAAAADAGAEDADRPAPRCEAGHREQTHAHTTLSRFA